MRAVMSNKVTPKVTRMTRPLLAGIVVLALANLGSRSVDPNHVVATLDERAEVAAPGPPSEWSVAVDGWRIEVDGVAVLPELPPRLLAVPEAPGAPHLPRLATYADSIGRYAAEEGLDWRLVAAVIAVESAFQPGALSPAGAFGLMQVKEAAAREVGVYPYDDPDSNIRAGVRYLAAMRRSFPASTLADQHAMMLAAYNMGPGHMRDARWLARELGLSAGDWHNGVASSVRLLEEPHVYPRLRHGFAQGRGVVRYVERVLATYASYRQRFPGVAMPSVAMIAQLAS